MGKIARLQRFALQNPLFAEKELQPGHFARLEEGAIGALSVNA